MMGLLSTRQIMEESVDKYADAYALFDIQLYSSYGFNDDDLLALRKLDYIEALQGSRMVDAYSRSEAGIISVIRVEETERYINLFELLEGRLPEKEDEIVLLANTVNSVYKIGETIEIYREDEDMDDCLSNTVFTIVGFVKSPAYMAKMLGAGNYKNLEIDIIGYIPRTNFVSDYYTTIYLTLKDARNYQTFTKDYTDFVSEDKADLSVFASRQQNVLKESLLSTYKEEIAAGEKELEEKRNEAQAELDEAKAALDDANIQIIASESQLESLQAVLDNAMSRQKALEKQYSSANQASADRIARIEKEDGRSFEAIYAELLSDYGTYTALLRMKDSASTNSSDSSIARLEEENNSLRNTLNNEYYPRRNELNTLLASEDISEEERQSCQNELTTLEARIAETEQTIRVNEEMIATLKEISQNGTEEIEANIKELNGKYNGNITKTYNEYNSLMNDMVIYQAMQQEMELANEAINEVNSQMSSLKNEIARGKKQYEEGVKQYQEALITFNEEMEKAESEIRKAYQELEELPEAEWFLLDRDSHYSSYMFKANAKQMGAIGIALPILFYLVAALVCMTTMTRLVDEQRGQIGIFRALGFSKAQIISKYVIYAVLASIIGSTAGIFIGQALFPTVIYNTWRLMYDLPEMLMLFPIRNVLICFGAFSLLMAMITALVVGRTLKEMPSQLMRPKAPKNARKVFLEYITFIWRRLSFTSKITARNLIRYKTRFFMTVIGVAGCTGLLIVGWGVKDSISDVVALQYGDILNYDYNISLNSDHHLDEIVQKLEDDMENEYVVPYMEYSSLIYLEDEEDKTIYVEVMDARKANDVHRFRTTDHTTEVRLGNSGVFISEKFARDHNIKKGDYITIESSDGIKASIKVSEVIEMYFQHYIFISSEYYSSVFSENVHMTDIAVKTTGNEALQSSLEEFEDIESIADFSGFIRQFDIMIEALDYIILVIIITAGSLAFVVLINLTQVNISERIREIATLKVLGFRNIEVENYIFKEILILTMIGALIGLPLGVVEHHFIMGVINMEMIMFPQRVKTVSFLYAFGVTMLFTLIVLFLMKKPLRKVEMIESLKSVE